MLYPAVKSAGSGGAQVTDCEEEGLEGVQSALGEYELDAANSARQNVYFTGIRIEPSSSDPAALAAWVALLRASNPSMVRPLDRKSKGCVNSCTSAEGRVSVMQHIHGAQSLFLCGVAAGGPCCSGAIKRCEHAQKQRMFACRIQAPVLQR